MSIRFSLTIIKGGKVGQTFRVDRPNAAMGRHTRYNDIVLNDPYISSKHARIVFNSGRFFLEDLGSTNKTFVNSVALVPSKPVALFDGMEFTLGKTGFRFNLEKNEDPVAVKAKAPPQTASFKVKISRILSEFNKKNIIPYTPILLGVALWALVMVVFWFVTTTLNP